MIRNISLTCFILLLQNIACFGNETIVNSFDDLQKIKPGETCLINSEINLNGKVLLLPEDCVLFFKESGSITNGRVIGNKTSLIAQKKIIFYDVLFTGEWNNDLVYSQWVAFSDQKDDNSLLSALMILCNGENLTHFYLEKGNYTVSAVDKTAPIIVPSNIYWHNDGVIVSMLPNDLEKYSMILIYKSNNVTIDGGCFIGDVKCHTGVRGEWGHGIKCSGSSNVELLNLKCEEFWGDGIDIIEALDERDEATINCDNITIRNVKCLYNRRQGLSIEAGNDITIQDCEFAYTGYIKSTLPAAGIDIEPWSDNNDKVWNIYISNSFFHDNNGFDLKCEPNIMRKKNYKTLKNHIVLKNCEIGACRVIYTYNMTLNNCYFYNSLEVANSEDIAIRNSYINDFAESGDVGVIILSNCYDNNNHLIQRH